MARVMLVLRGRWLPLPRPSLCQVTSSSLVLLFHASEPSLDRVAPWVHWAMHSRSRVLVCLPRMHSVSKVALRIAALAVQSGEQEEELPPEGDSLFPTEPEPGMGHYRAPLP